MEEVAGWVAPIATIIAAMMTAASLGPRITGWGFAIFAVGSVCWTVVGLAGGQPNLIVANLFLTVVNLVGIWRWLGREARLEDGARAARRESSRAGTPDLFDIGSVEGRPIVNGRGQKVAEAVGAMAEAGSGRVAYVVIRRGGLAGVGDSFHALGWDMLRPAGNGFRVAISEREMAELPEVDPAHWPSSPSKT